MPPSVDGRDKPGHDEVNLPFESEHQVPGFAGRMGIRPTGRGSRLFNLEAGFAVDSQYFVRQKIIC